MIDIGKVNVPSLKYDFSPEETCLLAKFFRLHQSDIPSGLKKFSESLENIIYNSISIEEAEKFYS